ncbi:MAG TPA: phosphoribosylanthranilate isomerase [Chryseolinea sp.]|nr:phosphoribosylanthranilate isomerase [Chryseolinea sp.]
MKKEIGIKICGLRLHDNIMEVATAGPDYLGFIEYPASPRYVGENFSMPASIPATIMKVGVFVNEADSVILQKVKNHKYDFVQLHGNESPEQCLALKDQGLKVIKVFSIDDRFDFQATKSYVTLADYFLFDTKGKLYGGNAQAFNWTVLRHYDQEVPFFLSGGLSIDNISAIGELKHMNLHALDLNSGVEISPGLKDVSKISSLISLIRNNDLNSR